jgi:hypothetical protein
MATIDNRFSYRVPSHYRTATFRVSYCTLQLGRYILFFAVALVSFLLQKSRYVFLPSS